MSWFRLHFPADVTEAAVADCLRVLAAESRGSWLAPRSSVSFETHLRSREVSWWLSIDSRRIHHLRTQVEAALPGVVWHDTRQPRLPNAARAHELRIDSPDRLLDTSHAVATVGRLLGVARQLGPEEVVVVQWQIGSWLHRSPIPPVSTPAPRTIWNLPDWGLPQRDSEQVQAARSAQAEHVFAAVGRVAVQASTTARRRQLLAATSNAYQLLRAPGVGPSKRLLPSWWVEHRLRVPRVPRLSPPVRLTATELACVIGWPIGNPRLPGVRYSQAPKLPLDRRSLVRAVGPTVRVVGESAYPAQRQAPAVLRPSDAVRHLHVVGSTGSGKSVMAARLILSDLAAGRSVVVLDPKGDLVTDLLVRLPERARERVAVLDPSDPAPAGFNPLSEPGGADALLHVFHSLWSSSWGPRLGDTMHAGLLTLSSVPGHTLAELPLLLTDAAFRRPIVAQAVAQDPLGLGGFWPAYEALSDEARAQVLAPIMNKVRQILLRPELRAVLGQASPRLDLRDVMRGRFSLLVRLPKGQLGEGSALIGSLLVSQLWRLGLRRAALPPEHRRPLFIYLDEVQDFLRLPLDLSDALVQARGLGIGLTVMHQHLGQLDAGLRAGILANAGSRVAFRLDYDDASVLAKRTGGQLRPEAFAGLGAYEAYASLLVASEATPYGSLRTLPLPDPTRDLRPMLAANRTRWGVPASETEERLRALIQGTDDPRPAGPIGGRRSGGGS